MLDATNFSLHLEDFQKALKSYKFLTSWLSDASILQFVASSVASPRFANMFDAVIAAIIRHSHQLVYSQWTA